MSLLRTIVLLAFLSVPACQGALRNSERSENDPRYRYCNAGLREAEVSSALQQLSAAQSACELNDRGLLQLRIGDARLAEKDWQAAQRAGSLEALWNRLRLFSILEDSAAIAEVADQGIAGQSQSAQEAAYLQMARDCVQPDQALERRILLERIWMQGRSTAAGLQLIGDALANEDYAYAEQQLDRLLSVAPQHAEAPFGLAWIRYRARDYARAAPLLERAMDLGSSEPRLCALAIEARLQLGEAQRALANAARCAGAGRDREATLQEGLARLRLDYRVDLKSLLERHESAADRRYLLRAWYGVDQGDGVHSLSDEWRYLQ
ncbi:MAG: hypothetical protein K1X75_13355 [Leptospirales bacterium]|nr:hypothetical protein [Leptospirales bacterium]